MAMDQVQMDACYGSSSKRCLLWIKVL